MTDQAQEVCILGSGQSILDLTSEELAYIREIPVRLALNKFAAFYDVAGVVPTHVFFLDHFSPASQAYLQHTFNVFRRDRITGTTFIVSTKLQGVASKIFPMAKLTESRAAYELFRLGKFFVPNWQHRSVYCIPSKSHVEFVSHSHWLKGGAWAKSLQEPLYHFRGSLTSALNYVSIKWPGRRIKLIGVDFNSPRYFFQEQMERLSIPSEDWTTPIVQSRQIHFSAIPHKGTTIFDRFDDVLEGLESTGNTLLCCNADSLLVTNRLLDYEPVTSDTQLRVGADALSR